VVAPVFWPRLAHPHLYHRKIADPTRQVDGRSHFASRSQSSGASGRVRNQGSIDPPERGRTYPRSTLDARLNRWRTVTKRRSGGGVLARG
jgi:hypothetical protein